MIEDGFFLHLDCNSNGSSGSTSLTMEYYHHLPSERKNKSCFRMMNYKNTII
jgi:hypothetical protein